MITGIEKIGLAPFMVLLFILLFCAMIYRFWRAADRARSKPREIVAGGALEESLTDLIAAQPSPPAPAEGEKPSAAAARELDARRLAWERAQLDMELTDSHRDAARAVLRKALEKSAIPHSSAAGRLVEALGLCE
jgi:hypothetical protein